MTQKTNPLALQRGRVFGRPPEGDGYKWVKRDELEDQICRRIDRRDADELEANNAPFILL